MMSTHIGVHEENCYILCGVEGCPRTSEAGQDTTCGLVSARIVAPGDVDNPLNKLCGSVLTVDHWLDTGMLDF